MGLKFYKRILLAFILAVFCGSAFCQTYSMDSLLPLVRGNAWMLNERIDPAYANYSTANRQDITVGPSDTTTAQDNRPSTALQVAVYRVDYSVTPRKVNLARTVSANISLDSDGLLLHRLSADVWPSASAKAPVAAVTFSTPLKLASAQVSVGQTITSQSQGQIAIGILPAVSFDVSSTTTVGTPVSIAMGNGTKVTAVPAQITIQLKKAGLSTSMSMQVWLAEGKGVIQTQSTTVYSGGYKETTTYAVSSPNVQVASASVDDSTCLFRWMEARFSSLLSPANTSNIQDYGYLYRYYAQTGNYLAIDQKSGALVFVGAPVGVLNIGSALTFIQQARASVCR